MELGDDHLLARLTTQLTTPGSNLQGQGPAVDRMITVTRPDLLPRSLASTFRPVALPGERGTVTVTFANAGLVSATGRVNVVIYATTTGELADAIEVGRTANVRVNLAPNKSQSVRTAVRLPSAAAGYWLMAVIDDGGMMSETNEDNNTILSNAVVGVREPFVDLVTVNPSLRATGPVKPGTAYTATVTLRNEGNVTAKGFVEIRLYASGDRAIGASDRGLLVRPGIRILLRPGQARTFRVRVPIPADIEAGEYYLIANTLPDSRLSFLELTDTNLANNVAADLVPFTVAE
jgi:hypothetical protein